jgi:hypothetical protein
MPYIPQSDRKGASRHPYTAGELAYKLQKAINRYINDNDLSYSTIAEVNGALHTVQFEFDRRVAGPYEDQAIERNGDLKNQPVILSPLEHDHEDCLDFVLANAPESLDAMVQADLELTEMLADEADAEWLAERQCTYPGGPCTCLPSD